MVVMGGVDLGLNLGQGIGAGVRRLIGGAVEVLGADLCTVAGLAIQKVAVMKLIEHKRVRARPAALSSESGAGAGAIPTGGADRSGTANAVTALTPLLLDVETESDIMTEGGHSSSDGEREIANNTPVPGGCEVLCNCGWLSGLFVFIIGNVLELVAFSFASQTDVALLSNFTLVWNAIISVFIFKEEFNVFPVFRECSRKLVQSWDAFHCVVLILGSMISVFCVPLVEEDNMDAKDLLHLWTSSPFVFWAAFMLVSMLATAVYLVRNWGNRCTGNLNAALIAGLCGFVAAFCATLSKVTTTLITRTAAGNNQFDSPEAILLCSLWVVLLVSQLGLLNMGLGAFEQGLVVPIYEIVGTLCSILSGILFYRTYDEFTAPQSIGFLIGVGLMSWGVWLVAHGEVHTQQELIKNLHSNLDELLSNAFAFGDNAFAFSPRYVYDDSQPCAAPPPAEVPVVALADSPDLAQGAAREFLPVADARRRHLNDVAECATESAAARPFERELSRSHDFSVEGSLASLASLGNPRDDLERASDDSHDDNIHVHGA